MVNENIFNTFFTDYSKSKSYCDIELHVCIITNNYCYFTLINKKKIKLIKSSKFYLWDGKITYSKVVRCNKK